MSTAAIGCYFVCSIKETEYFMSVKTSDQLYMEMSFVSSHDFWLENMERTLCGWKKRHRNGFLSVMLW